MPLSDGQGADPPFGPPGQLGHGAEDVPADAEALGQVADEEDVRVGGVGAAEDGHEAVPVGDRRPGHVKPR